MPIKKLLSGILAWIITSSIVYGQSVFINEVNYLISNPDQGIEVAGPAGQDLAGWEIVMYGIDGTVSTTKALSGVIPNQDNGYGAIWYDVEQGFVGNGAVLVDPSNSIIQFVSYGLDGLSNDLVVTAIEGIASGLNSVFVGVQLLPANSLQLTGTGTTYTDFVWSIPGGITEGAVNTNQFFSSLLPIELSDFRATRNEEGVEITWTTQSEINLDYFQLERSEDGRTFRRIYEVDGKGTETGPQSYRYIDRSPLEPISYYRLRNVDLDGSSETSKIIAISATKSGIKNLYQIPGSKKLIIEYYPGNLPQNGKLTLYDTSGRVLRQYELQTKADKQELDLSQLYIGAYFIRINLGGNIYARLIIIE